MARQHKDVKAYTVEAFERLDFPDDNKYELIDGELVMQASPSRAHQWLTKELILLIDAVARRYGCITLPDSDVSDGQNNYLRPDIVVECADQNVPVLIVEILSQDRKRDLEDKLFLYRKIGVSEYWVVDPKFKMVTVYFFAFNSVDAFGADEIIVSKILPKLSVSVNDLFALIDESGKKVLFPSGCEVIPFPETQNAKKEVPDNE